MDKIDRWNQDTVIQWLYEGQNRLMEPGYCHSSAL